jgi:glycosyltransferase involved in cell wall biosynthesis
VLSLYYSLNSQFEANKVGIYAGSVSELIDAIEKVWKNLELRQTLGEEGYEYFEKNYSIKYVSSKYGQVINRL